MINESNSVAQYTTRSVMHSVHHSVRIDHEVSTAIELEKHRRQVCCSEGAKQTARCHAPTSYGCKAAVDWCAGTAEKSRVFYAVCAASGRVVKLEKPVGNRSEFEQIDLGSLESGPKQPISSYPLKKIGKQNSSFSSKYYEKYFWVKYSIGTSRFYILF